jgi:hypothetical protein
MGVVGIGALVTLAVWLVSRAVVACSKLAEWRRIVDIRLSSLEQWTRSRARAGQRAVASRKR